MTDFLILGTDTDVGKTTFSMMWLSVYHQEFVYWKPVETGESDTEKVRRLIPEAQCLPVGMRFTQPVAPPLAARAEGRVIPSAADIATLIATLRPALPASKRNLLVETFGGPLSPLNEDELEIALIRELRLPTLLVSSSALGAISRTLKCLVALEQHGIRPFAVVLLGQPDPYAAKQIGRYSKGVPIFSLESPQWDSESIQEAAERQREKLAQVYECLQQAPVPTVAPRILPPSPVPDAQEETKIITPADEETVIESERKPANEKKSRQEPGPDATPVTMDEISRLLASDRRNLWHPYISLRDPDPPLVVVGAQDEFLHLADGTRIIDGISSWWTIQHGHRHPVLMAALQQAAAEIDHVLFAGVTHPHAIRLAELMLSTTPWSGGRVFYSDNGSTAVEVALKMAYQFWCHRGEPQRTLFIGFEHGYHGDTFGAMAASRDPVFFGRFEPLLFQTKIISLDAARLEETLVKHKGNVAGVLVEPLVQGAGGMHMHTPEVLRDLFAVTRRQDVLFLADEVMTGGGRLGPLWAHSLAGIAPDLICAAKTLTGGLLPLAATLVAPHLVAAFDSDDRSKTFFHGHSFTAHPLACAVAVANWQMLTRELPPAPARMEAFWKQGLLPLANHPRVCEVRMRGSIAAVELDVPGGYLADCARQLYQHCLAHGVLLRPLGNVLYTMPPFCTSPESLQKIAEAMTAAVKSL